jgi:hypothetical protein
MVHTEETQIYTITDATAARPTARTAQPLTVPSGSIGRESSDGRLRLQKSTEEPGTSM